jgi:BirA family biotin operon repressor/biotin-[acetyl-CoA-carboxylase] ligase
VDLRRFTVRLAESSRPHIENVVVCRRLDSTHSSAMRLIEQAETEEVVVPPTLIIALEQRSGLGRAGRRWQSAAEGLALSWISAELETATIAALPMIAAVASRTALARLGIDGAEIKWPNDILVGGRKIAGLLSHARHGEATWAAVGLGVNLRQAPAIDDPAAPEAIAVDDHLGDGDSEDRALSLVRVFVEEMASGIADPGAAIERWRRHLRHQPGESMTIRLGGGQTLDGIFVGVDADGHLQLDVDGVTRTISAGDVLES